MRARLATERYDTLLCRKTRCFTQLPFDLIGTPGTAHTPRCRARPGIFFPLSRLFFPAKQGHRSNRNNNILEDSFTVDFDLPALSRLLQRFDDVAVRLSPGWRFDGREECLGEGPLDFRIVQEKVALS